MCQSSLAVDIWPRLAKRAVRVVPTVGGRATPATKRTSDSRCPGVGAANRGLRGFAAHDRALPRPLVSVISAAASSSVCLMRFGKASRVRLRAFSLTKTRVVRGSFTSIILITGCSSTSCYKRSRQIARPTITNLSAATVAARSQGFVLNPRCSSASLVHFAGMGQL
jgi:hypothetical protein